MHSFKINAFYVLALWSFILLTPIHGGEEFSWGGELRSDYITLRNVPAEFSRKTGTTIPELNIFRQRIQLWGEVAVTETTSFKLGVMHEFREYFDGETPEKDYSQPSEFVLKTAYVDHQFNDALKLRLGRQDIKYGAGRIVWDPNPLDGSRTSFLDALKLSWQIQKTQLDFTLFKNDNFNDYVLNDDKRPLALSDVEGFMFYAQSKDLEYMPYDYYYLYTDEDFEEQRLTHTWGTRVLPKFTETLSGDIELAFQRGENGQESQQGLLFYSSLNYQITQTRFVDFIKVGFYHLSGDDPDTDKNEAWNGTFAGWPQFSTLAIISASGSEQGKGRLHNFSSPFVEFGIPTSYGKFKLAYWKMLADTNDNDDFGKDKGDLFVLKYAYPIKEGLIFEVSTEYMEPGDYYPEDIDDSLYMRVRLKYTF